MSRSLALLKQIFSKQSIFCLVYICEVLSDKFMCFVILNCHLKYNSGGYLAPWNNFSARKIKYIFTYFMSNIYMRSYSKLGWLYPGYGFSGFTQHGFFTQQHV